MKNQYQKEKTSIVNLFFFLIPTLIFCQTTTHISDQWIDKNENENYTARHECSFVQAGDRFIMFGGRESAKQLDVYDYTKNSWSKGGEAPKEFNHFQATFFKGFIWVIGSFKTNNFPREIPEESIWLYQPTSQKWIQGPEIPEDRRRGGAGLVVYNEKFYVVGGNTIGHDGGYVNWFDSYDPKTNTWTFLENASQARDHFHAAVLDDKLYAIGGRQSGGEGGVFEPLPAIVDVYDFKTQKWSVLETKLPTPRAAPGVVVFNNELLVMGGEGKQSGPAYKIVEAYNPKTKTWSRKADMLYPRHGTQAIISGQGIYIAAGSPVQAGGNQLNMEVYNKDLPEGEVLKASYLESSTEITMAPNTTKKIELKNTGGNTGSFIDHVELIGATKDQFEIKSNPTMTLIDADEVFHIEIENKTAKPGTTTNLCIVYNGDQEKIVKLIVE